MSIQTFWSPSRWTREFGYRAEGYTIVPGRHIGRDVASTGDVPNLVAGRVNQVVDTPLMGRCVEIDTGRARKRYLTYCHLAKTTPARGSLIPAGGWVGRVAKGPKTLPSSHMEFPGTSWGGQHVHLVESDIPGAAWTYPPARKITDFYNPDDTIRSAISGLASGGGYVPFEEDDLSAQGDQILAVLTAIQNSIQDPNIGILGSAVKARDESTAANSKLGQVQQVLTKIDNAIQDPKIGILGSAVAARDNSVAANRKLDELLSRPSGGSGGGLQAITDADLARIAKTVADEIARRMTT